MRSKYAFSWRRFLYDQSGARTKKYPDISNILVRSNDPPAGGCTITGTGGFTTISLSQAQVMSGSYTTSETIAQNTALTLTCGSATATATLGLVPIYQEI